MTAKQLILCRYDFFPELLLLGHLHGIRMGLISASLKGKTKLISGGGIVSWFYRMCFHTFEWIVPVDDRELLLFSKNCCQRKVNDSRRL